MRKFKNSKGFTLVEMLIVVAIIAILVAISIPLVNNALEKARDATDLANERSAKAEAVLVYLGTADIDATGITYIPGNASPTGTTLYYDAVKGHLSSTAPTTGYGKCTCGTIAGGYATNSNIAHTDGYLQVSWNADGVVTLTWTGMS